MADKEVTDEFSDVFYSNANDKSGPVQNKERAISDMLNETAFSHCDFD